MKPETIISLLVAAASLVSAAPAALAAEVVPRQAGHERFYPNIMVQLHENNPDHAFGDTDWGKVSRTNGRDNVQTLISIHVPNHVSGNQCRFVFSDPHDLGGSKQAQVFTVIGHIPVDATFNKRPSRNNHIATFTATWDEAEFTFGGGSFPCPAGETKHYELVPVNDNDLIEWYDPYGFAIESSATSWD